MSQPPNATGHAFSLLRLAGAERQRTDARQHLGAIEKVADNNYNYTPARTPYKTRFLVKTGNRLSTVAVEDVAFLRADDRIVFLHEAGGRKFILDHSLDDLGKVLNPASFFRINRRYIVPVHSIKRIEQHFNGKLHLRLKDWADDEIFVSREKAGGFKRWLNGPRY